MNLEKCRLCLCDKMLTSIFQRLKDSETISSRVMCLTKIEIHPDDGLPSTVCFRCIEKLDSCTKFVQNCIDTDIHLRNILEVATKGVDYDEESLKYAKNISVQTEHTEQYFVDENIVKNDLNDSFLNEVKIKNIIKKSYSRNNIKNGSSIQKQQCFTCGKVMSSRFRLKTHMRTHTGERPFSCPHCSKNFSLAQNLKVHLRIHTGEKPLKCSTCGATFAQSAGLAAHRRKHTGQTPYHCTLCPRSFRTIGHLQYHVRRHTGERKFECDSCSRAFITRSDLKQHSLSHSGERPHSCNLCGLCVSRASHLKRHIKHMHNGNKPFTCTHCPSEFTHKTEFEKHKKKHDKMNSEDNSECSQPAVI